MAIFSGFVYWRQALDIRSIAMGRLNYSLEHLLGSSNEGEHNFEQVPPVSPTIPESALLDTNLQQSDVMAFQAADGNILQSSGALTTEQIKQLNIPVAGWKGIE